MMTAKRKEPRPWRRADTMQHAVAVDDLCNVLVDAFPATKNAMTTVTADEIALELGRLPIEICKAFERDREEIEARMFGFGIAARVKPARVILWEVEE